MVRFYEFADAKVVEDLATALDIKAKQLDAQKMAIANRKKALANQKAQQANRDTVRKLATNSLNTK